MEIPINVIKEKEEQKSAAVESPVESPYEAPYLLEAEPHGFDSLTTGKLSGGALFFDYLAKICVFLAILLTPLFFFVSSDTLNLSKQLLLSLLALTGVASWLAKIIASGHIVFRKNWILGVILALALTTLVSSWFSSSFWVSFLGDTGRYTFSAVSMVSYLALFLVAFENFEQRDAMIAVGLWLTGVFAAAVYGLLQMLGIFIFPAAITQNSSFNTVGNVFAFSVLVLSSLPFVMAVIQEVGRRWLQVLLAITGILSFAAAGLVDFRVGWVSLAVSAIVLILINFRRNITPAGMSEHPFGWHYQKKIILPLAVIIAAVFFWFLNLPRPEKLSLPAEINPSYRASFDVTAKTWRESLVFGSGPETFPYVYGRFKSPTLNQTNFWGVNFSDANAELITWATTTGLLGTLVLLAFIFGFLWQAFKKLGSPVSPPGVGGLGEYNGSWTLASGMSGVQAGIFGSWVFVLATKFLYSTSLPLELMFWLLPALFILLERSNTNDTNSHVPIRQGYSHTWEYRFRAGSTKTLAAFFVLLVLLVLSLTGTYFSLRRWSSENHFVRALNLPNTPEVRDEVLNNISLAVAANPYEVRYFRLLNQVVFGKINDIVAEIQSRPAGQQQAKPEEAALIQNLTLRSLGAIQRAAVLDPANVSVLVDVAEAYRNLTPLVQGADDLSIQNYERAQSLEPINPFLKTQLAQLYLTKAGFFTDTLGLREPDTVNQAKALLEQALTLNSNYANARFFMALIQEREGEKDLALQNFRALAANNPDNKLLKQILSNMQQGLPALGVPPAPATPPAAPTALPTKGVPTQ